MLKIGQIGNCINSKHVEDIDLFTKMNLSEFDVIFVNIYQLNGIVEEYLHDLKDESEIELFFNAFRRSSEELAVFYEHGGIVFISLNDLPISTSEYLDNYNGNHLDTFGVFSLNMDDFSFEELKGSRFNYVEDFKDLDYYLNFRYHYVFKDYQATAIMKTIKTKDIVGVKKKINGGICYILPGFDQVSTLDFAQFGFFESKVKQIVDLNKKSNNASINSPTWVDEFVVYNEQTYLDKKINYEQLLEKLKLDIIENDLHLNKYRDLKKLVFAGDEDLEDIVEQTFRGLSFNVVIPEGNKDDLNIIEKSFKAVIEIKGVTKSGSTQHSMQLEKWVSNFGMENNGELVKGILVLNPFKDKKPSLRKDNPFPKDMVDYSTLRNHCLMLSEDLLNLYIDFQEKLISKDEIQIKILDTKGVFKYNSKYKIS